MVARPHHQTTPQNTFQLDRHAHFDSGLVEPGPPALLTDRGIVVLYNARNRACPRSEGGALDGRCPPGLADPRVQPGKWAVGQALLDAHDPTRVLNRTLRPIAGLKSAGAAQLNGVRPADAAGAAEAADGVIAGGLVAHGGGLLLYYGTTGAPSITVSVARAPLRPAIEAAARRHDEELRKRPTHGPTPRPDPAASAASAASAAPAAGLAGLAGPSPLLGTRPPGAEFLAHSGGAGLDPELLGDPERVYDSWVDYDSAIQAFSAAGMAGMGLFILIGCMFQCRRRGKKGRVRFCCFQGQGRDIEYEHYL